MRSRIVLFCIGLHSIHNFFFVFKNKCSFISLKVILVWILIQIEILKRGVIFIETIVVQTQTAQCGILVDASPVRNTVYYYY